MRICDTVGCDEEATHWTPMDNQICFDCVEKEIEEGEPAEDFPSIKSEKKL